MKKQNHRSTRKAARNTNPVGARSETKAAPVIIRILLARKGKVVSITTLQEAVQKAKGLKKEIDPKRIISRLNGKVKKFANKAGLKLVVSKQGAKLAA